MKSVSLSAFPRSLQKRIGSKKVRNNGRIPAVIYGGKATPQPLEVGQKEVESIIKHAASENLLIDLSIDQDGRPKRLALVQDVQHHPLTGKVLHLDFHEVAEDEKVIITVPVESSGEAAGVKMGGGVLEHVLFKIKVRALPKDLPEVIIVDVSELQTGQSLHLGDIKAPEGVEVLGDKKIVVLSVAASKESESEAETAAAPAGAQPEMIKEKKQEAAADKKAEKKK